MKHKMHTEFL